MPSKTLTGWFKQQSVARRRIGSGPTGSGHCNVHYGNAHATVTVGFRFGEGIEINNCKGWV